MKWFLEYEKEKLYSESLKATYEMRINSINLKHIKIKIYKSLAYYFLILIVIFPAVFNFSGTEKDTYHYFIQFHAYEITIKVKGTGEQRILHNDFRPTPSNAYLNSGQTSILKYDKHLVTINSVTEDINSVKLVWNSKLTSFRGMFNGLENILEVDLSTFDTSSIESMDSIFWNCKSITSINLSNVKTNKVKSMRFMFATCTSLKELDLSSFDTSNVEDMYFMFAEVKVKTLNISNFVTSKVKNMEGIFSNMDLLERIYLNFDTSKVTNMYAMFYKCRALTSVDVTMFDTSSAVDIHLMFHACNSLTSINVSNFDTSKVTDFGKMFSECYTITSLDISNFYTSQVTNMNYMFKDCIQLKSLDLSNFNTHNVKTMEEIFMGCNSLTSLDISNFDTSQITNMHNLFYNCSNLKSLNLNSFDTSNVINMEFMFGECNSLASLDLSNFNTNKVKLMDGLFYNCQQLGLVDLSNFDVSLVEDLSQMFYSCSSLTSLDLSNFAPSKAINMTEMFYACYNLKYLNIQNFDTRNAENMESMFSSCYSLTSLDVSKFNTAKVKTFNSMFFECNELEELDLSNFDTTSLTDTSMMFSSCKKLEYINLQKYNELNSLLMIDILDQLPEIIVVCLNEAKNINNFLVELNKKLCPTIYCGDDWKTKQKKIIYDNFTCADDCLNFKYENNGTCYSSCPDGANFCSQEIERQTTDDIERQTTDDIESQTTDDIESQTTDGISEGDTFNSHDTESSTSMDVNSDYFFDNITLNTNEEIYQYIIQNILNSYQESEGKEKLIPGEDNFIFQLTTLENEKNNSNNKISKINLGECEDTLRIYYHIDNSTSLIILKFEKLTNISTEKIFQYEVYEPINKTKLNLSICDNKISIYSLVELSDELQKIYQELKERGYDLFDINSAFYQDICVPFKSPYGTDVLLTDRISYYYHNNELICQSNCKPSNYSMESQYLKCDCDTSDSRIITRDIDKFTPNAIYQSFKDTLKFSNYKVLLCYKLPFRINSITTNIGSIIIIILFIIYIIFLIFYCSKGISLFKTYISKESMKKDDNKKNNDVEIVKQDSVNLGANNTTKRKRKSSKIKSLFSGKTQLENSKFPPRKKSVSLKQVYFKRTSIQKNRNISQQKFIDNNSITTNKIAPLKQNSDMSNIINQKEKLDDYELNNLNYKKALKKDKRKFLEIYYSILKRKHLIMFTFFSGNDYNILYIKLDRFVFLISTYMALNVFFFSDETMHKTFIDYGKYDFLQQIPQIIISTIASQIIDILSCYLGLTGKDFYEIKKLKESSMHKINNIIKCIKIKNICFFVFTFLLFAFYWYAIACFCSVYENTQGAFIKDSVLSFIFGLLYPLILYIIIAVFRVISLKSKKETLYSLVKFLM